MKTKRFLVYALVIIMLFVSLSGCGSSDESEKTQAKEVANGSEVSGGAEIAWEDSTVTVAISLDPSIFGPYQTTNKGRKQTIHQIYETLASAQGVGGELKGVLAKDWYAVDGEENAYIVELYDYITDSNGNQLTSDDVIYSFDVGYDIYARYLRYLETIEKIDDYTFKMVLNSSSIGAFEHILTMVYVIDQDSYEADGEDMTSNPVGTGPYKMVNYVEGSEVVLEAREDYWQTDENCLVSYQYQNVKTIRFLVIPEAAQQTIALETGTVDIVNGISATSAARFEGDSGYNITYMPEKNCRTIFFNCNEASVCSNLALRQAILYAIDSSGVLSGAANSAGEVAYCWGSPAYSDVYEAWNDGNYYEMDVEKSKALLEEAGYGDGVTVRLLTFTGETESNIANILYGYLQQVGITLDIMQYEEALVNTYMHDFTTFDLFIPQYAASPFYVVGAWNEKFSNTLYEDGLNYCGIDDPTLQSLLQVALNADTHTEELVTELFHYLTDNAYVYGLFSAYNYTVSNANVTSISQDNDFWLVPGSCTYVWN